MAILAILSSLALLALLADSSNASDPPLAPMLKITWSRGPNLPQGFQDSDGGILGDILITVGGYCGGGTVLDNQKKPGLYPAGFVKKAWGLDLAKPNARWQSLPEFPGVARQALSAARVDGRLYIWGGFNYTAPFCYADGWRLSRTQAGWTWEPLPPLPFALASAATAVIDSKIYLFGGADYEIEKGFHTDADRTGKASRLGARLHVLDTRDLGAGWKELPPCPGTPRFIHTMQAVDGKLYVIGGAVGPVSGTVVDNWRFDPATPRWSRLSDLPIASGNFPRSTNLVFAGRYILLPGGYQYGLVANPDGSTRAIYGQPSRRNPAGGLCSDVFVYDTQTDRFGAADALPIDNNLPMAVIRDERICLLGGETGGCVVEGEYYGHHPELLLVGRISLP